MTKPIIRPDPIELLREAPQLGYRGVQSFCLLGSFGEIILAGRHMEGLEPEYTTWLKNLEGTGLVLGRYTTDWEQAKADFICRSGLFPHCKPWTRLLGPLQREGIF